MAFVSLLEVDAECPYSIMPVFMLSGSDVIELHPTD